MLDFDFSLLDANVALLTPEQELKLSPTCQIMESPHLYDETESAGAEKKQVFLFTENSIPSLSEIETNEAAFDLEGLIGDNHVSEEFLEDFFGLVSENHTLTSEASLDRSYMPQPQLTENTLGFISDWQSNVKLESGENQLPCTVQVIEEASNSGLYSTPSTPGSSTPTTPTGFKTLAKQSKAKRGWVKDSEEYKAKRARNNVAVRRSRDKAKHRQQETEDRVKSLTGENEKLQKKLDLLQKELNVLKGLFVNVGAALPPELQKYLSK